MIPIRQLIRVTIASVRIISGYMKQGMTEKQAFEKWRQGFLRIVKEQRGKK